MSKIELMKLAIAKKEFPSIKTSEEALARAIEAEGESRRLIGTSNFEFWVGAAYRLTRFAELLEKKEKLGCYVFNKMVNE